MGNKSQQVHKNAIKKKFDSPILNITKDFPSKINIVAQTHVAFSAATAVYRAENTDLKGTWKVRFFKSEID